METFNDLRRRPSSSRVANSSADGKMLSFNASGQRSLDDIGVGQGIGERAASRHRPRRGRAPTADGERDSDSGARDHGRNDGRNDEHLRRSTAAHALARDRGRRSRLLAALPCLFTAHES